MRVFGRRAHLGLHLHTWPPKFARFVVPPCVPLTDDDIALGQRAARDRKLEN